MSLLMKLYMKTIVKNVYISPSVGKKLALIATITKALIVYGHGVHKRIRK